MLVAVTVRMVLSFASSFVIGATLAGRIQPNVDGIVNNAMPSVSYR